MQVVAFIADNDREFTSILKERISSSARLLLDLLHGIGRVGNTCIKGHPFKGDWCGFSAWLGEAGRTEYGKESIGAFFAKALARGPFVLAVIFLDAGVFA